LGKGVARDEFSDTDDTHGGAPVHHTREKLVVLDVARQASTAEVERLGFDIGVVVEVLGGLVTTAKAVDLARKFLKAAALGRSKVIEIKGPTGARTIKLDGKTEAEVEAEILKALPFLK